MYQVVTININASIITSDASLGSINVSMVTQYNLITLIQLLLMIMYQQIQIN